MSDGEESVPTFGDIAKKILTSADRLYYTQDEIKMIYTDWANHYLERSSRHKRLIQDLQRDVTDGVLLADIIEAVTNEKLKDIKPKPKNDQQMLENISLCLKCIENLGVNVEGLKAEDIREGNLRAILGLFFSLSRHKQQKKSGLVQPAGHNALILPSRISTISTCSAQLQENMLSKLPSPFKATGNNRNSTGTMPQHVNVSVGQPRRTANTAQKDKVTSNGCSSSGIPAPRTAHTSVTAVSSNSPQSFLVAPGSSRLPVSVDKENRQSRSSSSINSGISAVSSTSRPSNPSQPSSVPVPGSILPPTNNSPDPTMGKNSMFGFGGFFHKSKQEKTAKSVSIPKVIVPRNGKSNSSSSSSGISSTQSEYSSGSGSSAVGSDIVSSVTIESAKSKESYQESSSVVTNSPKLAIKNLAKKTFARLPAGKEGPKLLRIEPRNTELGTPDGGRSPIFMSSRNEPQWSTADDSNRVEKLINKVDLSRIEVTKSGTPAVFSAIEEDPLSNPPSISRPESISGLPKPATKIGLMKPSVTPVAALSSSIPRPVGTAKLSTKIPKPEKRLSFTPSESVSLKSSSSSENQNSGKISECVDEPQIATTDQLLKECENSDNATCDLTLANKTSVDDAMTTFVPAANDDKVAVKIDQQSSTAHLLSEDKTNGEVKSSSQMETTFDEKMANQVTTKSVPKGPIEQHLSKVDSKSVCETSESPCKHVSDEGSINSEDICDGNRLIEKPVSGAVLRAAKPEGKGLSSTSSPIKSSASHYSKKDVGSGYLSDGEVLRSSTTAAATLRLFEDDCLSGYISEGSSIPKNAMNLGYSGRAGKRGGERMPIVNEHLRCMKIMDSSNGTYERVDLDESAQSGTKGPETSNRFNHDSNFERGSFSYSSLNRLSKKSDEGHRQGNGFLSPALMRVNNNGDSSNQRRMRPAPISPPPRDPETTLSTLVNGQSHSSDSSRRMDNYLSIYASPVRKPRQPPINDVFSDRTDRHPGDLFARPTDDVTLTSNINSNEVTPLKQNHILDRRSSSKVKISGSTQTNPRDISSVKNDSSVCSGTNGYSTGSLNRSRPTGNGYHPPQEIQMSNPPRSRSVVNNHSDLSLTSSVHSDSFSSTSSRFSMPNQQQELTLLTIDRGAGSNNVPLIHSALPPKSIRQSRLSSNGHGENIYERLTDSEKSPRSSGGQQSIYSSARIPFESGYRENGFAAGLSIYDRNQVTQKCDSLAYQFNYATGVDNNYEDVENGSTASYPTNGLRASTPASPLLTYSLPRHQVMVNGKTHHGLSPYVGSLLAKIHSKDDEAHGSAGSLASTASSLYSSPEERHAYEVRKLRRELEQAQERVASLTNQLCTNTHVVAAFENSLNNMTHRLEMLTCNAQQKDGELLDLRRTIEALRQQGAQAGLISADSTNSYSVLSPSLVRRHTFNSSKDAANDEKERQPSGLSRQLSTDSVASLGSIGSNCSEQVDENGKKKNKKKSWAQSKECVKIRSSFNKAFRVGRNKNKNGSVSDAEIPRQIDLSTSVPSSPLLQASSRTSSRSSMENGQKAQEKKRSSSLKPAGSFTGLDRMDEMDETALIEDLQRQLREKEMTLNDFRLEALNSAQQLDHFKEAMTNMKQEIETLRQDNTRLQRLVSLKRRSLSSERKSPRDGGARSTPSESGIGDDESPTFDARRVSVKVVTMEGEKDIGDKKYEDSHIGTVKIFPAMQWTQLDNAVKAVFQDYMNRLDVMVNLGLNADSIECYYLGTACRQRDAATNVESLPIDYLKNDVDKIRVILKGSRDQSVDTITFDTLLPKSVFSRYISLISQHKRVLICGPSGTGKSFLARKMAHHLVIKSGRSSTDGAIATFSVDQNSSKDLRQYLLHITEQCENDSDSTAPCVVIIDNLHHAGLLGEVFNGFLSFKNHRCPYIIGTMNPTGVSMSTQQLSHNFKWILYNNQTEPLQHFLGRFLRRKMIEHELSVGICDSALTQIVEWIPRAWQEINTFLEKRSSSSVTVGPRLFMECPMSIRESQLWFTFLWNFSMVPYIMEALREGLQLYGRIDQVWEDPTERLLESYPWPALPSGEDPDNYALTRIRPEDVGFYSFPLKTGRKEALSSDESEADPLSNMLSRLQEVTRNSQSHFEDGNCSR